MRCSANGASLRHKATFFALKTVPLRVTYTSSPPAGGASPQRGSQSWGRAARLAEQTRFATNTETFSSVYPISVGYRSRLARSPGGLGGRRRIEFIVSPLPRRRHNESHFAAQSPERSFFFPLFLSPRKKKRLLATQSQNLCRQIKKTAHTGRHQ